MSTNSTIKNGVDKSAAAAKPLSNADSIRSSMLESAAQLKSYSLLQYIVKDAYIDAMDMNNSWRVARISEINGDILTLSFDGWSKKWDETIKIGSSKLAAFRRFTPPYTGGTKNTLREFEFSDAVQKFPKHKKEMERMIEEKFLMGNPHQLTQYVRGELYIVVDAILSTNSKLSGTEELKACVEFLESFLLFFIKYLDLLPLYLKEFIEAKSINPLLYLVNEKVTAVSCFPEMFESVLKIFGGGGARSSKFYQQNEFQLQQFTNPIVTKPKDKYSSSHNQIVNFINFFGTNGGFDRIIALLKWESEGDKKEADGDAGYKFPLTIIDSMLIVVEPVVPLMTSQFKERFFNDFKTAFFHRVENISPREIKDVDPSVTFRLIRNIQPLLDEHFGKEASMISETAELNFALKMIKSQYLEKRIKGIQEFKDFIDRADQDSDFSRSSTSFNNEKKRPMRHYNPQKLVQFIHSNKILDIILGENFHVEVFKRALPVFRFLVKNNNLLTEHLNLFWKAYETKHEDSIRAVFEVIIDLSKILPIDCLEFLFNKMMGIPQEKFDDAAINLIKEFSLNAMNTVGVPVQTSSGIFGTKKTKGQPNTKYEYFGLKLLWDLIQDSSKLDPQHTDYLLNALSVLFKSPSFKYEREKYLNYCFENVKKGVSVAQSLKISLHIFHTYTQTVMWSRESSIEDVVTKYNKDFSNLIELVVLDFDKYMSEVQKALERLKSKGAKIESPANYIFVGKYAHSLQIENRLVFIETLGSLVQKKYELTLDHLKTMWNVLIKRAVFDVERNVFFNWLTKQKESQSPKRIFTISDSLIRNMFSSIFLDRLMMDNYQNISLEVFNGIQELYFGINLKEDNLETTGKNSGSYKVKCPDTLIGTEFFWNTLINCPNEAILKIARNILCNLYLKFAPNISPEARINIWMGFTVKCVDYINSSNNELRSSNVIALLREFFINFDGRKYLNSDTPSLSTMNLILQLKSDERMKREITMPSNSTIYFLRMRAMEEFGIKNYDIELMIGQNGSKINSEIEEDYNIQALDQYIAKDGKREKDILIGTTKIQSQWIPRDRFKLNVSNTQKVMDTLFELLSGSNMRTVEYVWEILTFLPVNKQVRNQIERLNVDTEEQWSKILDSSCFRKLLYCLQIIEEITRPTGEAVDKWTLTFLKNKGLSYLYKIYLSIPNTEVKSTFYIRCFSSISRLLAFFIKKYFFAADLDAKTHLSELTTKTLALLNCGLVKTSSGYDDPSFQRSNSDDVNLAEYITASFELIQACIEKNLQLMKAVYDFPELNSILKIGLLSCESTDLRKRLETSLLELIEFYSKQNQIFQKKEGLAPLGVDQCLSFPHIFFLKLLINEYIFKANLRDMRNKCKQFFSLLCTLLEKTSMEEILFLQSKEIINLSSLLNFLVLETGKLTPFERSVSDNDYLLQGILKLIETLLHFEPKYKDTLAGNSSFMKELIHSCLFEIPTGLEDSRVILPPKCKSPDSRKASFNLLGLLLEGSIHSPGILELVDYMSKILSYAYWRTGSQSDWNISPNYMEKSSTGFVGLKNLGCTCYMNSLMQQFYMIPDFRNSIVEVEEVRTKVDKQDNLLYQFQMILSGLKNSHKPFIDPKGFCLSYKDFDNKPINVLEQMDVDEFFNNFLDKLENELKASRNEHIIKKLFGGVMTNELICKGCPHYSEREELFLAVSLQVKNKKNISESLTSFIEGEMLEGDNAYQCDKCDKRVPTLKRTCIKKLPNILILVLKRFEFDFDTMSKSKVNDFCEFPRKIDMRKYTQGYLKAKEKKQQEELETNSTPTDEEPQDLEFPREYYEYQLKGVIIHMGTADSGHYYSLISDKFYFDENSSSDNWFRFDDTVIRPFDASELGSEAFGGEEKFSNLSNMGMTLNKSMRERTRNAYMLFYQRTQFFNEEGKQIPSLSETNKSKLAGTMNLNPVEQEIKEDNLKFYINKHLFDLEFFNFVHRILQAAESLPTMDKNVVELVKIGFLYFLSVVLRAKDRDKLPRFLKTVKKIAAQSYEISNWFIQQVSNEEVLSELLIECPIKDMRYLAAGLIKTAAEKIISDVDGTWDQKVFQSKSSLAKLVNCLVFLLGEPIMREQRKVIDQFYRVFSILSTLSKTVRTHMVNQKMVGRILYYIQEVPLPQSYKSSADFKQARSETRAGIELGNFLKDANAGKNQIKTIEDLVERKKEKSIMDSLTINYSHLIVCISTLIASMQFSGAENNSPFVPYEILEARLEKDEIENLQQQQVWKRLFNEATSKASKLALARMFGHLCYSNKDFSAELIKVIFEELNKADEDRLKTYLILLEAVLPINDKYQEHRLKDGLEYYFSTLKDNMGYYKVTDIMLNYLFKMCSRNSTLFAAVNKFLNNSPKNYTKVLETWIRDLLNMGKALNQGSLKLYKRRNTQVNFSLLSQDRLSKRITEKLGKLRYLVKGESEKLTLDYDSDEDFSNHKFKPDERFDYNSENGTVKPVVVVDTIDDMIFFRGIKEDFGKWVHYDSERLGSFSKLQNYYEENF